MTTQTDTYHDSEASIAESYRRIHANSEQTHVLVVDLDGDYAAVALDLDPREYEPVSADLLGYDPTLAGARQRATRWQAHNPKGVAADDSGQGLLSKLFDALDQSDQLEQAETEGQQ